MDRPTTSKEIARITAGAVTALVIVGWLLFLAIAFMSAR
jgi:tetrahydromethanopterin S-methyltransferase subunit F